MAILNGIMGPGLAGVLTEMNSVVEFVSRQLSLPPPVMKIVSSDNLKDDSLNFDLNTVHTALVKQLNLKPSTPKEIF